MRANQGRGRVTNGQRHRTEGEHNREAGERSVARVECGSRFISPVKKELRPKPRDSRLVGPCRRNIVLERNIALYAREEARGFLTRLPLSLLSLRRALAHRPRRSSRRSTYKKPSATSVGRRPNRRALVATFHQKKNISSALHDAQKSAQR